MKGENKHERRVCVDTTALLGSARPQIITVALSEPNTHMNPSETSENRVRKKAIALVQN